MRGARMRQPCAAPAGRQDRGSVPLLLALLMVALLALIGLVIDGGRKLNQSASAHAIAQEAARAGAGMVDRSVAYRSGTFGVDEAQALAAARAYLVSAGYTGSVSSEGTQKIRVTVPGRGRTPRLSPSGIDPMTSTGPAIPPP